MEVLVMKDYSEIIGNIEITIRKNSSKPFLSKLRDVKLFLEENKINLLIKESNLENDIKLIVRIVDIGNILDKHMKEVFKIILSSPRDKGNFLKLIDRDKEFFLPEEIEECLDWFIIEK